MGGGKIIFKGGCYINNNSFIVQGADSTIIFGEDFVASTLKIISFKHIEFGAHVSVGWDVLFMDSNFHPLYDMEK